MTDNVPQTPDVSKQLLAMLPEIMRQLTESGQAAKIGDAINKAVMDVVRLVKARLDTDANYAAGIGELARTAARRAEQLEKFDKQNLRLEDDLHETHLRIGEAIAKVETLYKAAEDLPEGLRGPAREALFDVLKTLGKEHVTLNEPADPPEEPKQGTATCDKGHTWPCAWSVDRRSEAEYVRIVFPEACPTCGGKWQEVETPDPADEKDHDA